MGGRERERDYADIKGKKKEGFSFSWPAPSTATANEDLLERVKRASLRRQALHQSVIPADKNIHQGGRRAREVAAEEEKMSDDLARLRAVQPLAAGHQTSPGRQGRERESSRRREGHLRRTTMTAQLVKRSSRRLFIVDCPLLPSESSRVSPTNCRTRPFLQLPSVLISRTSFMSAASILCLISA